MPRSLEFHGSAAAWDDYPVEIIDSHSLGPHQRIVLSFADSGLRFKPGQFLNLSVPGHLLRRPLAPAGQHGSEIELIVTPFGPGTHKLVRLKPGSRLRALAPLGNSFPVAPGDAVLIGAGAGAAPLAFLAARLLAYGRNVTVLHGAPSNEDAELVRALYGGLEVQLEYFSEDGSLGRTGLPTAALHELLASGAEVTVYSVGPYALMKAAAAVALAWRRPAFVSLDAHMACGVGACLSCAVMTKSGQKHACKDGPVFAAEEVRW